uniref:Uncharacterized protein n=1 Tax=Arundo donax TaxID=35708 RepID=A0A0A8YW39_ARUDO
MGFEIRKASGYAGGQGLTHTTGIQDYLSKCCSHCQVKVSNELHISHNIV